MKIVFIRGTFVLLLFSIINQAKTQSFLNLNEVSLEEKNNSSVKLKSLINDVQPSIYFVNQEQNFDEEKNPIKVVVDGHFLNKVISSPFNKSNIQLIEIHVNKNEDFDIKIDLYSYQKQFEDLKYITFILTFDYCLVNHQEKDCLEKKIEETLQNYPNNNIQIVYLLSIND